MVHPPLRFGVVIAAALGWSSAAHAVPTGPSPICPSAHPELARGFALTGWFDGPVSRPPDLAVLKALRDRGMAHIRLPVTAESVMTRFTTAAEVEKRRRAVEAAIDTLTGLGYGVVVDLHGAERLDALFHKDPEAAREAVIHAWSVLGPGVERRAAKKVLAEVLNEPPLPDAAWVAMQAKIVAAMRKTMPKTTLVVSTGGPQRTERLTAATPIADANTVYAVHYYDPMVFTHQGAEWIRPNPIGWLTGVPYPIRPFDSRMAALSAKLRTAGLKAVADYVDGLAARSFGPTDVQREIKAIGDWSRAHGRQVVIGEFGVYRPHASPSHRTAWLAAVTAAAKANCVGWTHWEYRDGFGLADGKTGKPDEATLIGLTGIAPATATAAGQTAETTAGEP
jgi:endoglucanase